jgi:hypothetical protein
MSEPVSKGDSLFGGKKQGIWGFRSLGVVLDRRINELRHGLRPNSLLSVTGNL